jgi:alpha-beta hydrolase superfamily lysophospholipase
MEHGHSSFKAADGTTIYTASWTPDTPAKAAILIVHGVAEHIHRYEHVAAYFVERGYAVYGVDHRGHGKSEGLRTYFDNFDQPVDDLKRFVETLKPQYPKMFLYGHSMGSLISLLYVLKYPNDFKGLISTSTPLDGESTVSPLVANIGKLLDKIIPKVNFLPLDSKTLSTDPAVVAKYDADPLVDRKPMRIHMGVGIGSNSALVKQRMGEIKLPLLILHGSKDGLCPSSGSEILYKGIGSADKTLKIYDGWYHELHNEPQQGEVFQAIVEWLDAH